MEGPACIMIGVECCSRFILKDSLVARLILWICREYFQAMCHVGLSFGSLLQACQEMLQRPSAQGCQIDCWVNGLPSLLWPLQTRMYNSLFEIASSNKLEVDNVQCRELCQSTCHVGLLCGSLLQACPEM